MSYWVKIAGAQTGGDGTKNVTTAGTPEQLSTGQACRGVLVRAKTTNTGNVKLGMSATPVHVLTPGEWMWFAVGDLKQIYVDVTVNGEGVVYTYVL